MKIMKKVLAGVLSLAVVVGACFAFAGCNSVKNKTYAYDSATFTIVKAVDDNGKITETLTLSFREYYIYSDDFMGEGLGKGMDYATYTMTAEEEEAFADFKKVFDEASAGMRLEFGKDTVDQIFDETDKVSGDIDREVSTGRYEIKDDKITVTATTAYNEHTLEATYEVETWNIVDGKIEMRDYTTSDADHVFVVGELYYQSGFFAKTK